MKDPQQEAAKEYAKNLGCEEGIWLWKIMADFAQQTTHPLNLEIEQLRKERDELKAKYNLSLKLNNNLAKQLNCERQQLNADKQKNEEFKRIAEIAVNDDGSRRDEYMSQFNELLTK